MLDGLGGALDVIVPRGGRASSIACSAKRACRCSRISKGWCTSTSTTSADSKAVAIVVNSKMRRTGVCGAARPCWSIARGAAPAGAAGRSARLGRLRRARRRRMRARRTRPSRRDEDDWRAEYLDAIIAVRVVDGLDAAIAHIET